MSDQPNVSRQQAELMEKEKSVNERQRNIFNLQKGLGPIKQRMGQAVQDQRRAKITLTALQQYENDPGRVMYQAMGRMFVKRTAKQLGETYRKEEEGAAARIERSKEDKKRLDERIANEQGSLQREVTEFTTFARAAGLVQQGPGGVPVQQVRN
jgi:chaperonin cofactor prefoldin